MESSKAYSRLTVRQLSYIPVSKYGHSPTRRFYKLLVYRLVSLGAPDLCVRKTALKHAGAFKGRNPLQPPLAEGRVYTCS
ncbi:hypothetical protein H5T51_02920 [Candidatus Bathyarchaeota archaeon]|nr:hypothetical protein [Candidatus Bathyarchaeota archaeon]